MLLRPHRGAPQLSSSVDLTLTLVMLARVVPAIGRSTSGGDGPVAVSQNPPLYPGNAGLKALLMLQLGDDLLARQHPSGEREEQRSEPDRARCSQRVMQSQTVHN